MKADVLYASVLRESTRYAVFQTRSACCYTSYLILVNVGVTMPAFRSESLAFSLMQFTVAGAKDRFRGGDRVRVRNSLRAMLGTVNSREPEGTRRRYVVEFDPKENQAEFLERGVFYEDELELRDRAFGPLR
jgi:hypothetical protein